MSKTLGWRAFLKQHGFVFTRGFDVSVKYRYDSNDYISIVKDVRPLRFRIQVHAIGIHGAFFKREANVIAEKLKEFAKVKLL